MNELKKKQLEIAKKIVDLNGCDGISCYGTMGLFKGNRCPFVKESMHNHCTNDRAVSLSKAYLKKHSKISRKDLLERIEKLEEKVEKLERVVPPSPVTTFKAGTRFLSENGVEYILARGRTKAEWCLVCLITGLTWNGIHREQREAFGSELFTMK